MEMMITFFSFALLYFNMFADNNDICFSLLRAEVLEVGRQEIKVKPLKYFFIESTVFDYDEIPSLSPPYDYSEQLDVMVPKSGLNIGDKIFIVGVDSSGTLINVKLFSDNKFKEFIDYVYQNKAFSCSPSTSPNDK